MPVIWSEGRNTQPKTLVITVEGENKKTLKDITKKLSKEYVVAASNARKKQVSEGIKFLEEEQPRLLERVTETQKQLESFRLKNSTTGSNIFLVSPITCVGEKSHRYNGLPSEV